MTALNPQSYRLSFNDAVDTWLRYWAGEYQHTIAASYGVNPARVSEVVKSKAHLGSEEIAQNLRVAA